MRILMISDTYFPRISGVATSIQSFRHGLQGLGHTVDLIIPDYGSELSEDSGITRIPSWSTRFYPEERLMQPLALLRLRRELQHRQYDLVHIQTPFIAHYSGHYLARFLRVPLISSYHTYFEAYLGHYYAGIPAFLRKMLIRLPSRQQAAAVNGMIVPSMAVAKVLWGYGIKTPIQVIPTGIDLNRPRTGDRRMFRQRLGIRANQPTLLYAGRIAPEKNIALLLEMLVALRADFPDILLLLAGDGPSRETLERAARQRALMDHVRFLGYLDRETALLDAYAGADLLVFASESETQGMVLLEALAASLPIVAVPAMGAADVLSSGLGTRSVPAEASAFADACSRLLKEESLRQQLAGEARALAEQWSEPMMVKRLEKFYRQTLAGEIVEATSPSSKVPRVD